MYYGNLRDVHMCPVEQKLWWWRVATPEYPTDDSCDMGQWYDNPWDVQKYATCRLDYTDDGTEEENNG